MFKMEIKAIWFNKISKIRALGLDVDKIKIVLSGSDEKQNGMSSKTGEERESLMNKIAIRKPARTKQKNNLVINLRAFRGKRLKKMRMKEFGRKIKQ